MPVDREPLLSATSYSILEIISSFKMDYSLPYETQTFMNLLLSLSYLLLTGRYGHRETQRLVRQICGYVGALESRINGFSVAIERAKPCLPALRTYEPRHTPTALKIWARVLTQYCYYSS